MQYVASYVGSEEIKSGEMQGKFIVNSLNGKPAKAIILLGPLGLEAQIKRTEGNKRSLLSILKLKWSQNKKQNGIELRGWKSQKTCFQLTEIQM